MKLRQRIDKDDISMTSQNTHIVLVTGGTGCLGQHLIGLLQTHASYITEIRVLDLRPYENKLDYTSSVPVRQYCGSITDVELVREACKGVSTVFHIASVIDPFLFPDDKKMEHVNVRGTAVLLDVSKEAGVSHFVYCSTAGVVMGHDDINGGTEESTIFQDRPLHYGYSISKQKGETMVLERNCSSFKTVAIRPVTIFGEEDAMLVTLSLKAARKLGRWQLFDCKGARHQFAYAGNVAWVFICADRAMTSDSENLIGGNAFFASDDTPLTDIYEFVKPFATACNFAISSFKLPMWSVFIPVYILHGILWPMSPFFKPKFSFSLAGLKHTLLSHNFKYEKAKSLLNYTPLYTFEEALQRSIRYYEKYRKW